jgi:hypothetical protein
MVTLTLLAIVLFCSMLRPSAVDRIAGLFFQSSVGLFPYLSITSIVAPVSTGLLSLLALSVVEAKPCRLLKNINIPLHGVDSLAADLVAANSLVNVGLEH